MDSDEGWQEYKAKYAKEYADADDELRHYEVFDRNRKFIEAHTALLSGDAGDAGDAAANTARGAPSYSLSLSKFSDWLDEELEEQFQPMPPWEEGALEGASAEDGEYGAYDEYGGLPLEGAGEMEQFR